MTVSTRTRLIIALCVVLAVIAVLIRTAVIHASTFYVTVSELYAEGQSAVGQQTTVSGNIVGSSVQYDPSSQRLVFSVRDTGSPKTLPVTFHGPEPDDFSNDWPVVVTGTLNPSGIFVANQLLIKCPSKYQASNQTTTKTFQAVGKN